MIARVFASLLLVVPCLCGACRNKASPPAAPEDPGAPAASARAAPAAPDAPAASRGSSAPAASIEDAAAATQPVDEHTVTCKSANDCWLDDDHQPIARPPKVRGRKVVPCEGPNGGHTPDCKDGKCVVVGWRC